MSSSVNIYVTQKPLDEPSGAVIGFMASTTEAINQLYVHVDYQGQGIGSMLVERAKQASSGRLGLFTFESNSRAQRFYEQHGFKIIGRGFEESWQLEDIQYEWTAEV